MSMREILQRIDALSTITEGTVTPTGVKHGLNAQQKSVKQMPALFKSKDISPVLSGSYGKKHPAQGYLVGANESLEENDPVSPDGVNPDTKEILETDIDEGQMKNIDIEHQDWKTMSPARFQSEYGMSKAQWEAKNGSLIGRPMQTKGSQIFKRPGGADYCSVCNRADNRCICESDLAESTATTEDVISTVKKKLGDYLSDLSKEIKQDSDLKDKVPQDIDKISPSVKTITTDDGKEIKIHGNEDDGFRITIKNKEMKSRFDDLDEAVLACEMFMNRRRSAVPMQEVQPVLNNNDYVEEKK